MKLCGHSYASVSQVGLEEYEVQIQYWLKEKNMVHLMFQSSTKNLHPLQDEVIKQNENCYRQDDYLKSPSNRNL
jgi:hypothetical protein